MRLYLPAVLYAADFTLWLWGVLYPVAASTLA
jgi:hypothetical protein